MSITKKFRKKAKREKLETLKAQALARYRKAQIKAREQLQPGWGQPEPKVFITPKKDKKDKSDGNTKK